MRAAIVSNGEIHDLENAANIMKDCHFIVCADGGTEYVLKCGLMPNAVVGDLDSVGQDVLKEIGNLKCKIIKYPREKDYTDTQLAIDYAISQGADEIMMLGSIGSRIDHSLANILLMIKLVKAGITPCIINENNIIYITDNNIKLRGKPGDTVSLIPVGGDVTDVYTSGLKYGLNGNTLSMGEPIGVSNVFLYDEASVAVGKGFLLVIKSND